MRAWKGSVGMESGTDVEAGGRTASVDHGGPKASEKRPGGQAPCARAACALRVRQCRSVVAHSHSGQGRRATRRGKIGSLSQSTSGSAYISPHHICGQHIYSSPPCMAIYYPCQIFIIQPHFFILILQQSAPTLNHVSVYFS